MKKLLLMGVALLASCSKPPSEKPSEAHKVEASNESPEPVLKTESGPYRIELNKGFDMSSLPANADLKMADGKLDQYAIKLCGLDFANTMSPTRCEVFVQPDKNGLLVGYITLADNGKVNISTAVETDRQRTGGGCFIDGVLEKSGSDNSTGPIDINKDFHSRIAYNAWEKSPGDWMVAPVDEQADSQGAIGVWYAERSKDKLRVSQERWSYCYSDPKIFIDEVFYSVATLTKAEEKP